MPFNPDKLAALLARSGAQTGGKGTIRRKKAVSHKPGVTDDKRVKATLNKLQVRDIPAIEEVNLFKDDDNVIHFVNPKVQASIASNTYVVSGPSETKKLADLLPGIIQQLGPDNLNALKKIYAQYANSSEGAAAAAGGADDEEEVPDLVENFEDVSNKQ